MEKRTTEAWVLTATGEAEKAFEKRAIPVAEPQKSEVLIETEAFGLNYADVMARHGLYREAPPLPAVIGYEICGVVREAGSPENEALIGKRVLAFTRFGGYARQVVTPATAVIPIGDMPAEDALSLCTQGGTAYYMSELLCPAQAGEKVLVHAAAGGVGTLLIQLLKMRGAEVFAKVSSAEKAQLVRELGADHVLIYTQSDYTQQARQILGKERFDVVYNPVGGKTFKKDLDMLGAGGRIILYGGSELASSGSGFLKQLRFVFRMGLFLPIAFMMKSRSILGVNMLKIADHRQQTLVHCLQGCAQLYQAGKLKPVNGGNFAADQLPEAHRLLESGHSAGKISVHW